MLQIVQFIVMAIPVYMQLGVAYTGGNRDEQKQPARTAGRLKRALDNHFEGLILFIIAVVVVVLGDASNAVTERCAWVYLWAGIFCVPAYGAGIFLVRSLIWTIGFGATAIMLVTALAWSWIARGPRNGIEKGVTVKLTASTGTNDRIDESTHAVAPGGRPVGGILLSFSMRPAQLP